MLDSFLSTVLSETMAGLIADTVRHLMDERASSEPGASNSDLELANWFNTYLLTEGFSAPQLPQPPPDVDELRLKSLLGSDRCHALLHELLAARLCDAPEEQIGRLENSFIVCLRDSIVIKHRRMPGISSNRSRGETYLRAIFDVFDKQVCELTGRLEGTHPEMIVQLRQRAIGTRIISILDAIAHHLDVYAEPSDPAEERRFYQQYLDHIAAEFGKVSPPDFERRRLIPLDEIYVEPQIRQIHPLDNHRITIGTFAGGIDRTVLLGEPGAGKTTAARALMHMHAKLGRRIPFLVTLRDFSDGYIQGSSVVSYIEYTINRLFQTTTPSDWVRRKLLDGAAIVIFDGLDELIDASRRAEVAGVIEHFCIEYPLAHVLVTSRKVGYDQAALDERQFSTWLIEPFNRDQVLEYAKKWFSRDESLAPNLRTEYAMAFFKESEVAEDIRSNPLLLALMCVLYRGSGYIPQRITEVYRRCADLLFHQWDASRHIHVKLILTEKQVEGTLRHLAHWLYTRESTVTAVVKRNLVAETANFLCPRYFEDCEHAETAANEFIAFCSGRAWILIEAGLTPGGDPLYSFAHRTFLEYFTAAYLTTASDTPEQLAALIRPRLLTGQWQFVANLAIAIRDNVSDGGGERTLDKLLDFCEPGEDVALISFVASCVKTIPTSPRWTRKLVGRVLDITLIERSSRSAFTETLKSLLQLAAPLQELIASEIAMYVDSLAASDEYLTRRRAYDLVESMAALSGEIASQEAQFWHGWAAARYTDMAIEIERDAAEDASLLHFIARYVTGGLERALRLPGGLRASLGGRKNNFTGLSIKSIVVESAVDIRDAFAPSASSLEICDIFGRYLADAVPAVPWSAPLSPYDHYTLSGSRSDASSALAAVRTGWISLGTVAVLALEVESAIILGHTQLYELALSNSDPRGWLGPFIPYIRERLTPGSVVELKSLKIHPPYQELFRSWARGEIDLIG